MMDEPAASSGRGETDDDTGQEREGEGIEQNPLIDVDLRRAHQVRRHERHHGVERPARDEDAQYPAGDREQHAFDEQLPDDGAAAGAKRCAERDLASARRCASQQQVRDVEAGDRQQHADRRVQHDERRLDLPGQLLAQRDDRRPTCSC